MRDTSKQQLQGQHEGEQEQGDGGLPRIGLKPRSRRAGEGCGVGLIPCDGLQG